MDTHRARCRFRRCGNLVVAVSALLNNFERQVRYLPPISKRVRLIVLSIDSLSLLHLTPGTPSRRGWSLCQSLPTPSDCKLEQI